MPLKKIWYMLPFLRRKYYESFSFHEMTPLFIKFRGQKDTYRRKSPHRSTASSTALILWPSSPNLFLSCCHPKNTFQQLIPAPEDILRGRRGLSVLIQDFWPKVGASPTLVTNSWSQKGPLGILQQRLSVSVSHPGLLPWFTQSQWGV